jgi:hypothetical protein
MSNKHIMVDTETLGIEASAIVMSIGACSFSLEHGILQKFYAQIAVESYPGSVDLSTLKFWMAQAAKGNPAPIDGVSPLAEVISAFNAFVLEGTTSPNDIILWANGTDFDIPKLQYAYKTLGAVVPWKYNNVRDCRTIFKTFPDYGDESKGEAKHNALADAVWQAERLISVLKNLGEETLLGEFK